MRARDRCVKQPTFGTRPPASPLWGAGRCEVGHVPDEPSVRPKRVGTAGRGPGRGVWQRATWDRRSRALSWPRDFAVYGKHAPRPSVFPVPSGCRNFARVGRAGFAVTADGASRARRGRGGWVVERRHAVAQERDAGLFFRAHHDRYTWNFESCESLHPCWIKEANFVGTGIIRASQIAN